MHGKPSLRLFHTGGGLAACIAMISFLALPARAESPVELDLGTALSMALEHNPALLQARERLREQDGRSKAVGSVRWPHLELTGTYYTEQDDRLQSFGGDAAPDDYDWNAGIQVTQPLYGGGRLLARVREQRELTSALEQDYMTVQADVLTDVHRTFYDALLARESIAVRAESLVLLERQRALAQNRFDAGAGPRFDVLQAEVRVANARPPLLRARNDYRLALEALRNAIGIASDDGFDGDRIRLAGELTGADAKPPSMDSALEEALSRRSELRQLRFERDAAGSRLKETERQRWPVLSLFGDYSFSHNRYNDDPDTLEGWSVGVRAAMPLWEGGRIRGEIIEARSQLEQFYLRETSLKLAIELEVRQALNNLEVALEILETTELVIEQAREALRLAENRFNVGETTQLDVLASQLELTQAQLEKITVARDYHIQRVLLDRALGRLPGAALLTHHEE